MSGNLFFGGVPTKPQVEKLMGQDYRAGNVITYDEVAQVIGEAPRSNRFRTITNRWRKLMLSDHQLRIVSEGGTFRVLTAAESVDASVGDMKRVGRAAGRTAFRVEQIPAHELDERTAAKHSLLRRHTQAMLKSAQENFRAVTPPPVRGRIAAE